MLVGLVIVTAGLAMPLRAPGGDTVPGRFGAALVACTGEQDLAAVDWLSQRALAGRLPYYAVVGDAGRALVSTFGPTPAWLGAPAFLFVERGAFLDDRALRARARVVASLAVGVSAFFLALAGMARAGRLGALAGLVAGLSFAGIPSLSQGLWQQTAALPALAGMIMCVAFGSARAHWLLVVPALGAVTLWARPGELLLVLALGMVTALEPSARKLPVRAWLLALALAVVVSAPWAFWHLRWSGTLVPFTGQWQVNTHASSPPFVLEPARIVGALAALLWSPGEGLIGFAPIAFLPLVRRDRAARVVTFGALGAWVLVACFHRWWGGIAFGPRLLALPLWVLVWGALPDATATAPGQRAHWLRWPMWLLLGAWTALVGVVGGLRYDPRGWELSVDLDAHPEAVWSFAPSPWTALAAAPLEGALLDAPDLAYQFCAERPLVPVAPR
jgi:hypothetical protein